MGGWLVGGWLVGCKMVMGGWRDGDGGWKDGDGWCGEGDDYSSNGYLVTPLLFSSLVSSKWECFSRKFVRMSQLSVAGVVGG